MPDHADSQKEQALKVMKSQKTPCKGTRDLFIYFLIYFIEVQLIYNVMLISAV